MGQKAASDFQAVIGNTKDIPRFRYMLSDSCWLPIEEWDKFNHKEENYPRTKDLSNE